MSSGLLITGFPRSGTTLALRVLCSGLHSGNMTAGGPVNEPKALSWVIDSGNREEVDEVMSTVFDNGFGIIKHPFASLILRDTNPTFKVLSIFRDVREVVCSVFVHHNRDSVLGMNNSWRHWVPFNESMSKFDRVLTPWKAAHMAVASYVGEKEVWTYGKWGDWRIVQEDIRKTYPDPRNSSAEVLMDVMAGKTFSDSRSGRKAWDMLKWSGQVGEHEEKIAEEAIDEIISEYEKNGVIVDKAW